MLQSFSKPHLMSQILRFPEAVPSEKSTVSSCKSLKLMLSNGFIKHVHPGIFTLMPLAVRSMEKLCNLIDHMMAKANGQKILFPSLVPEKLMKTSGRWNSMNCLFKLEDSSSSAYCLGPTHEELATYLLSKYHISYKLLPLRLYQISSKFRDELNPKLGLLRGREFLMKDMYGFDSSEENSCITYDRICELYSELFKLCLGIDSIKVQGSSGDIGGKKSHEFHFKSDVGEDIILFCPNCKQGMNTELLTGIEVHSCNDCKLSLEKCNAIEVGHAFMLGTKYSEPFNAKFDFGENKLENCHVSCFGLGVSRILAACLEHFSTSTALRWPLSIVPYHVSVIPPKRNSKEEAVRPFAESIAQSLNNIDKLSGNVLIDDRINLTIGKRLQECSEMGIPYIIVVGKPSLEDIPKLEIIDVYNKKTSFLSHRDTMDLFKHSNIL